MHAMMVPLAMNTAREEVILALTSHTCETADIHRLRAARLLKGAICCMKADPEAAYNWSLLGSDKH